MTRLDHALALAKRGLLIFPLSPRVKIPFKDDPWKEMMTTDEATIRKWFADRPDMNYGVCPGEKFFVIDLDRDAEQEKDGVAEFETLQDSEDPTDWVLNETFTVRSPRGGLHLYVASDQGVACSRSTFARGVDIRGGLKEHEGYVVGPGSYTDADPKRNTAAGEYVVENNGPMLPAPAWVRLRVATSSLQRSSKAQEAVAELDLPAAIEQAKNIIAQQTHWPTEGEHGDDETLGFCFVLRDYGISQETAFDLLHEPIYEDGTSWNERCNPPWEDADLSRKLRNAFKYASNQPGAKAGLLLAQASELGADEAEKAEKEERLAKFASLLKQTFPGTALASRVVHLEMAIPQWMPMHGMVQVLAKRGVGKTILTLDTGLRMANDMDWHGEQMRKGICAVYAVGEDDFGVQEHYNAWLHQHKMQPAEDRFIIITCVPNLMEASEARMWAEYVKTRLPADKRCAFFIDTWQRATNRGSQNDEEQMNIATDNAEGIGKYLGGPVVCNFHPPKHNENTISGTMILENKGTTLWGIAKEKDGNGRRLQVLRIKGKGEGNEKRFFWNEVSWGEVDEFGKPRTGIVPKCEGGTGMAVSQEAIERRDTARSLYATLIAVLKQEFHGEGRTTAVTASDFSTSDTAKRIIVFMKKPEAQNWRSRFQGVHDTAWSVADITKSRMEDGLYRHLSQLFGDGQPTKTDAHYTGGVWIKLWQKNSRMSVFTECDPPDGKRAAPTSEMESFENGEFIV